MREAASFIAGQSGSANTGALQSVLGAALHALRAWHSRRQVTSLRDFDEHMLSDIGLTRRDVHEALQLPFGSDPARELQARASRNRRRGWNE
jgi:uncharacterized protein YjiS (DUF1127 family)